MTINQRRVNYLVSWFIYYYKKSVNLDCTKPSYYSTYPLSSVVNDEQMSNGAKINAILKEMVKYYGLDLQKQDEINFWYAINDWIDNNQSYIDDCNGRRLLEEIEFQIRFYQCFPCDLNTIFNIIYQRVVMRITNPNDNDIKDKSKKMYAGVIAFIKAHLSFLPERKMYLRFSNHGALISTQHSEWARVTDCINHSKLLANEPHILHYGVELEGAFDSEDDFSSCCDELLENNLINQDNLLIPTSDGSINGEFPVEWHIAPISLAKGNELWPKIVQILEKHHFSHDSDENDAGLHIHFDRSYLTPLQQIKLRDMICSNPNIDDICGRDDSGNWASRQPSACCSFEMVYLPLANATTDTNGNILCKQDARIHGGQKYAILNFQHSKTLEFRGFNANKPITEGVKFLDDLIRSVKEN